MKLHQNSKVSRKKCTVWDPIQTQSIDVKSVTQNWHLVAELKLKLWRSLFFCCQFYLNFITYGMSQHFLHLGINGQKRFSQIFKRCYMNRIIDQMSISGLFWSHTQFMSLLNPQTTGRGPMDPDTSLTSAQGVIIGISKPMLHLILHNTEPI